MFYVARLSFITWSGRQEPDKLRLIDNETFRRSVERIQGARWDKWRNQKDWLEEIRQFTNIEVVKKNVEFQLEGAGDYSAMINKVEPESGESYDAAFFRQFVAPELLRQSMGTEGDEDEEHFEDTLYKTLKPTADALVHINLRQHELNDAEAALDKFEPVEAKARDVLEANASYEDELSEVIRDAAVVHVLSVRDPIPGMPTIPRDAPWRKDSKLSAVIASLVIDKTAGVLIADHGVAKLLGIETKRVNERAMAVRVRPTQYRSRRAPALKRAGVSASCFSRTVRRCRSPSAEPSGQPRNNERTASKCDRATARSCRDA